MHRVLGNHRQNFPGRAKLAPRRKGSELFRRPVELALRPRSFRQQRTTQERPMSKMLSTITVYGLLTISAAYAQSGQPFQAKIPFAFRAQNTTLVAGTYQLTYNPSAHRIMIHGLDSNSGGALATAMPTGRPHTLPSSLTNPVRKSSYSPEALPCWCSGMRTTSYPVLVPRFHDPLRARKISPGYSAGN